eukprot:2849917-Pyramimonas_sp.AAC.1
MKSPGPSEGQKATIFDTRPPQAALTHKNTWPQLGTTMLDTLWVTWTRNMIDPRTWKGIQT